jgi:uncharacterized protein (DUF433 family)
MTWQDHIVADKQVLLGKPIIKGTRIPVELILELYGLGWTEKEILDSYPFLTTDSLRAVFDYLKDCLQMKYFICPHA